MLIVCSSLITACGAVIHRPDSGVSNLTNPLFTVVFDDGNDTDYLVAKKLFEDQGAVASTAVTTDLIGTPHHLTPGQIGALQDAGWEIMSHTVSHPNLNTLTEFQLDHEMSRSKMLLENMGCTVRNIVYPYNKNNQLVRKVASRYYRSGRGGGSEFNTDTRAPYLLTSFSLKHDLPRLTGFVDQAYKDNAWLIVYTHEVDAKVKLVEEQGTFIPGETVHLSPSGAIARYTTRHWFPVYGAHIYVVPLAGTPQSGDQVVGTESGATARINHVIYNDVTVLSKLLTYIRTTYQNMKIVTIDQGLDLLGVPRHEHN